MQNLKTITLSLVIGIALAGGLTFAAISPPWDTDTWHSPSEWISNGATISAQKIAENFEYLLSLHGDSCTASNKMIMRFNEGVTEYCDGVNWVNAVTYAWSTASWSVCSSVDDSVCGTRANRLFPGTYSVDGHTISASATLSGYPVYNAFNGSAGGGFSMWSSGYSLPAWIQYQFPIAITLGSYTITPRSVYSGVHQHAPIDWTFSGSMDGTNWSIIDTKVGQSFAVSTPRTFNITPAQSFTHYRLRTTKTTSSGSYNAFDLGELSFVAQCEYTQTRVVTCQDSNGYIVDEVNCTETKPEVIQSCVL